MIDLNAIYYVALSMNQPIKEAIEYAAYPEQLLMSGWIYTYHKPDINEAKSIARENLEFLAKYLI